MKWNLRHNHVWATIEGSNNTSCIVDIVSSNNGYWFDVYLTYLEREKPIKEPFKYEGPFASLILALEFAESNLKNIKDILDGNDLASKLLEREELMQERLQRVGKIIEVLNSRKI